MFRYCKGCKFDGDFNETLVGPCIRCYNGNLYEKRKELNTMPTYMDKDVKDFLEYCAQDLEMTKKLYSKKITNKPLTITNVIFNDPATIVFWSDNTKTVVKCDGEAFDPEKGLAMAIAKKALGNKGNYYNKIKKWLGDWKSYVKED